MGEKWATGIKQLPETEKSLLHTLNSPKTQPERGLNVIKHSFVPTDSHRLRKILILDASEAAPGQPISWGGRASPEVTWEEGVRGLQSEAVKGIRSAKCSG